MHNRALRRSHRWTLWFSLEFFGAGYDSTVTIAGFYLCPEGIVLGADSTSSVPIQDGLHYFNFTQKLFEIGEGSTLGLLTWGLGGLGPVSFRTLLADLADELVANPPGDVSDVAQRWIDKFWIAYTNFKYVDQCNQLHQKLPYDPLAAGANPGARTEEEEAVYLTLKQALVVGFCIGGYVLPDRTPQAMFMIFDPINVKPQFQIAHAESELWWGVPNIIDRLITGADVNLVDAVIDSGKWTGTKNELLDVVTAQRFRHGTLPMRDAVDYVHSCIHSTIKAMKFSNMSQVCGGPIEIAVITSDRKFRWVRHKQWDAAIVDGDI